MGVVIMGSDYNDFMMMVFSSSETARGSIGPCGQLAWWPTGGVPALLTPENITFPTSWYLQ